MAYDFPSSPTNGQIVTGPGGIQWQWDGAKWTVISGSSTGFAPINNPVFTGDPQAPTPSLTDSDQSLATTAFTQGVVAPVRTLAADNIGRNLFHNALFNIQQRGQGPWTTFTYTLDRWQAYMTNDAISVTAYSMTDADRTAIGDEAARNALQYNFVGSSTANSGSEIFQPVENVRRLSGKTVTVSFWAHATSGTPKLGISYQQSFGSGGSPSGAVNANLGVTPNLSTTWQRYSVTGTLPSAIGKTFGTTPNDNTVFSIWFSDNGASSGQAGGIGVQSGTVQFWGMQLEIGPAATPLEKLDPQLDLANCQRFYQTFFIINNQPFNPSQTGWAANWAQTFAVTMRAAPTITFSAITYTNTQTLTGNANTYDVTLGATASSMSGGFGVQANLYASADL